MCSSDLGLCGAAASPLRLALAPPQPTTIKFNSATEHAEPQPGKGPGLPPAREHRHALSWSFSPAVCICLSLSISCSFNSNPSVCLLFLPPPSTPLSPNMYPSSHSEIFHWKDLGNSKHYGNLPFYQSPLPNCSINQFTNISVHSFTNKSIS